MTALAIAVFADGRPACGTAPPSRRDVSRCRARSSPSHADHKEATIKHEEIKGFMPAMTMPYKVRDAKEFEGLAPGDLSTRRWSS